MLHSGTAVQPASGNTSDDVESDELPRSNRSKS